MFDASPVIYLNGKRRSHIYCCSMPRWKDKDDVAHWAWCALPDWAADLTPSTQPTKDVCKACLSALEEHRLKKRIRATGDQTVELPLFNVGIDEAALREILEGIDV